VSAPFGRVPFALRVFDGMPGIDPHVPAPPAEDEDFGFRPPSTRADVRPDPSPQATTHA
jgi:hypothetical protein